MRRSISLTLLFASGFLLASCGGGGTSTSNTPTTPPSATISSVGATCALSVLPVGQSTQCSATVEGSGDYSTAVSWSVNGVESGNATLGTVSSSGLYTAPAAVPTPFTLTITATSNADSTKSANAPIVIAGTISTVQQSVSASSGGVITLPDGSSVSFPPNALPTDQTISVSEVSALAVPLPQASIASEGPILDVKPVEPNGTLGLSKLPSAAHDRSSDHAAPGLIQFTLMAGQNSTSGLEGSSPIVAGQTSPGQWSYRFTPGAFDPMSGVATASVDPADMSGLLEMQLTMANVGSTAETAPASILGGFWWDGQSFQQLKASLLPACPLAGNQLPSNGKLLVLVHGMMSTIQSTFTRVSAIEGSYYGAVAGVNYDWSQRVATSGSDVAAWLNDFALCPGVTEIGIEAHSEGVPVVLSAGGQIKPQAASLITNVVSVAGPIMGTPLADDSLDYASMLLNGGPALNDVAFTAAGLAKLVNELPPLQDLTSTGDPLAATRAAFVANLPRLRFIAVGGTNPDGVVPTLPGLQSSINSVFGAEPNDGIVPLVSALGYGSGIPIHPLPSFNENHVSLVNEPTEVIPRINSEIGAAEMPQLTCQGDPAHCSGPLGEAFAVSTTGFGGSAGPIEVYGQDSTGAVAPLQSLPESGGTINWSMPICLEPTSGTYSIFMYDGIISSNNIMLDVGPGSCTISVTVTPAAATVVAGGTQDFSALINGVASSAVTWSVQEGASGGEISPAGEYTASASPGTYHVVAASDADSSASGTATVTVALGSSEQGLIRLTNDSTVDNNPAWSPDGTRILFASQLTTVGDPDIWEISPAGNSLQQVTTGNHGNYGGGIQNPVWLGSTGDLVVLDTVYYWEWDRLTLSANPSLPVDHSVANGSQTDFEPLLFVPGGLGGSWLAVSPDGTNAAWDALTTETGQCPSHTDLHVAPINALAGQNNNTEGQIIASFNLNCPVGNMEGVGGLSFSPDGSELVVATLSDSNDYAFDLSIYKLDGTLVRQLTTSGAGSNHTVNWQPSWSSDNRIAFSSNSSGQYQIYTINADGTDLAQITSNGGASPNWSPDASKIAFSSNRSGNSQIYVILAPSGTSGAITSVSVSCSPTSILTTQVSTCTPIVTGTGSYSSSVIWSASPSSSGSVSTAGVFTPVSAGTASIMATSTQDPTKNGTAVVAVTTSGATVTISPSSVTVPADAVQTFTAAVSGGGGVTWSIQEGASGGMISTSGIYSAPTTIGTYHVVATNSADSSQTATAIVTVIAAPSYSILYSFPDAFEPAALVQGTDGNLYGTNELNAYKITSSGGFTELTDLSSSPDAPISSLIQATDGNFYGVDSEGTGSIFQLTPSGALAMLYSFPTPSPDSVTGLFPWAGIIQGTDGDFYGTTYAGGNESCTSYGFGIPAYGPYDYNPTAYSGYGCGTVYRMDTSGNVTVLYSFSGQSDGNYPQSALIQGADGNLYGTTSAGGASQDGTVFKITVSGSLQTLHSFSGSDGNGPVASLVQGTDGDLYGTTAMGGAFGYGEVFRLDTSGNNYTVLHSFSGADGSSPVASLIQGSDGNFYGTTWSGGDLTCGIYYWQVGSNYPYIDNSGCGTVFKMDSSGNITVLHTFEEPQTPDGNAPYAGVIFGKDGYLYGTTYYGGASVYFGTIFRLGIPGSQ